jgi:response regulator RpfG family c-di-GMP phosphodiesterase
MVLDIGVKMLKRLGYSVIEAQGGRGASEIYEENRDKIDIVIFDIILLEINSGEVFDKLKAFNPAVKVLLSSGYSIDSQANEILKRGCDSFVQKLCCMKELSGKIREILSRN